MSLSTPTRQKTKITVAYGDGIGPEIMDATLRILTAAEANIEQERIDIGESIYLKGISNGIEPSAWESLRTTRVLLKAPITTPQGGGFKSLNVTIRKVLGLYANVRPCVSYAPFIASKHPGMDVVIIRENEEDVYGGIEHRQTNDVYQCLKLISRPGCERIVRYAFEYARSHDRKRVTCFTKDNIMKFTDGLFHKVFNEIGEEYPEMEKEHWIVDIGAAKLADTPEVFDVIVMPNLYGDVLSDVAAQIAGSVGLAGSANIGKDFAMFEAIHGSAPRRAGQNLANPSGLLLGAVMMLVHIGQLDVAQSVHNAWLRTIESGVHTYDIYTEGTSNRKVGTREFADAVIANLGKAPLTLPAVRYAVHEKKMPAKQSVAGARAKKTLVGVDVFIDWNGAKPDQIANVLQGLGVLPLKLTTIANRGTKVWPDGNVDTFCVDHWACRFVPSNSSSTDSSAIAILLAALVKANIDFVKIENLYDFDGERGYSLAQGQ